MSVGKCPFEELSDRGTALRGTIHRGTVRRGKAHRRNVRWGTVGIPFFTTRCYFLCMSSVGIMNMSLKILVVFESREFRKTYIDFSNITNFTQINTFPIESYIINLFHNIWGI